MNDDYYSPHPRFSLQRALVIGGQLGCGARVIGRWLCGLTGLPFVEVDRQIEHDAGQSLARLVADRGAERLESLAVSVLEKQGARRPHAVIVLDHVWPTLEAGPLLRERMDFVHVTRSVAALRKALEVELYRAGGWIMGSAGCDVAAFLRDDQEHLRLLAHREPLLGYASILLDGAEDRPQEIAARVIESLQRVAGAQPI